MAEHLLFMGHRQRQRIHRDSCQAGGRLGPGGKEALEGEGLGVGERGVEGVGAWGGVNKTQQHGWLSQ